MSLHCHGAAHPCAEDLVGLCRKSNRCNSDQADVELCAGTENRRIGELNLPLRLLSKKSHNHPQPYRMAEKWDYQTEKIKNFELRALRKNCLQSKSSVWKQQVPF